MEFEPQAPSLSQGVIALAKQALEQGRPSALVDGLRIPLGETGLFVADNTDEHIRTLSVITHEGVTYKVGPLIDSQEK